jgi:peptide/nickel transport system substrate-binding protein
VSKFRRLAGAAPRSAIGASLVAAALAATVGVAIAAAATAPPKIDPNAEIRIGVPSPTTSLDPASPNIPTILFHVWDRLTTFDEKGNIVPMLATSWTSSKDGKSLTFKLRTDVKFHDGTPVDAAAVKASLDRNITLPGSAQAANLASIDNVQVVDKSTVRLNLKYGGAELLRNLAGAAGAVINPKCIAANVSLTIPPPECSSGGMVVDHETIPTEWVLKKAPGKYWDPKAFRFQAIDTLAIPDAQTLINALQAGQLDLIRLVPDGMVQARALIKSGQYAGKPFAIAAAYAIFLNPRVPPFNNPLLRKAFQAAFDQNAIANQLFAGNCPPTQQPALPNSPFYNHKFQATNSYSPDKAKQYLAQAGVPNGFTAPLFLQNNSALILQSQVIQDQLSKVGIQLQMQIVPQLAADARVRAGSVPAVFNAWGNTLDPDGSVALLYNLPDARDAVAVGSPVEQQLQTLRFHALDPRLSETQRGKVYQAIWKLMYDQALVVSTCQVGNVWLHTKNLQNADTPLFTVPGLGLDVRYVTKTQ